MPIDAITITNEMKFNTYFVEFYFIDYSIFLKLLSGLFISFIPIYTEK